jgi:hypothetical protein
MFAMKNNSVVLCALIGGLAGCSSGDISSSGGDYSGPSKSSDASGTWSNGSGGTYGAPGTAGGGGTLTVTTTTAPPEQETKVDYMTPRGGDQRVYIANPTRNTVTIINSVGPTITEQVTGDTPTYVATVPGQDVALVINTGSHTLRVLREDAATATSYPVVGKANAIAISPDGLHAVVWFDATQVTSTTTSTASSGSTQEVSVVNLGASGGDKVYSVSVGYNPSTVVFSSDSSAAFIVTDDGISELRFANITAPGIAPFTRIDNGSLTLVGTDAGSASPDSRPVVHAPPRTHAPAETPDGGASPADAGDGSKVDSGKLDLAVQNGGRDVGGDTAWDAGSDAAPDAVSVGPDSSVAPDAASAVTVKGKAVDIAVTRTGDYAIARRQGTPALLLVDLKAKTVSTLMLSSEVTDLDLVDTATGAQAFAVLRSESTLVRIDIPTGFTELSHRKSWPFSGSMIGSVTISAKGTYALLYTTAVASKDLAVFDLVAEQVAPTPILHKTIRAVAIAPDEKTALVLHTKTASSSTSSSLSQQEMIDQAYGYTMVNLTTGFSKLITTSADPNPFIITPDSSDAFVLLRDDKASIRTVQRVSLDSFIQSDFGLGSPPSSIAALSVKTKKVFVGQVYPEGRISFINWDTDEVQTVTGFALNGRIQQ